jgi:hypothetical protein
VLKIDFGHPCRGVQIWVEKSNEKCCEINLCNIIRTRVARSSGFSGKIPDFTSFSGSLPASGFFPDFSFFPDFPDSFRIVSGFPQIYDFFKF